MRELRLILDNRERNLEIIESLRQGNIELSFMQLPVGDYIVSDRMCIERKTVRDFESSLIDARLFDQAKRLRDAYEKPIIILEGQLEECTLGRNVVLGTILALYADYGLQVINSSSPSETSYLLSKFAEREQLEDKREPRLRGSKKAYTLYQWQLIMLGSMPGIGMEMSKRLLGRFKSIRNLCNAEVEELMNVDKIGRKKADKIYEVLNSEFVMV